MSIGNRRTNHETIRDLENRLKKLEKFKMRVGAVVFVLGIVGVSAAAITTKAIGISNNALAEAVDAKEQSAEAIVTAESASAEASSATAVADRAVDDIKDAGEKQCGEITRLGGEALDSLSGEIASGLEAIMNSSVDASERIVDAGLQEQGRLDDQRDAIVRQLDSRARDLQASLDAATADQIRMSPQAIIDALTGDEANLPKLAAALVATSELTEMATRLNGLRQQLDAISEDGIGASVAIEPQFSTWQTAKRAGFVLATVRGGPDSGHHGAVVLMTRPKDSRSTPAQARNEWSRDSSATGSVLLPIPAGHEWRLELATSGTPNPDVSVWWLPLGVTSSGSGA